MKRIRRTKKQLERQRFIDYLGYQSFFIRKFSSLDNLIEDYKQILKAKKAYEKEFSNKKISIRKSLYFFRNEKVISSRELNIMFLLYGLENKFAKPRTLDETGKLMGISRERIRQIRHRILEKINSDYEKK